MTAGDKAEVSWWQVTVSIVQRHGGSLRLGRRLLFPYLGGTIKRREESPLLHFKVRI